MHMRLLQVAVSSQPATVACAYCMVRVLCPGLEIGMSQLKMQWPSLHCIINDGLVSHLKVFKQVQGLYSIESVSRDLQKGAQKSTNLRAQKYFGFVLKL